MKKQLLAILFVLPLLFSCVKTPTEIDGTKWKYVDYPRDDVQMNFYLYFSPNGTGNYEISTITAPSKDEVLLVRYNVDKYIYEGKKLSFTCSNEKGETFTMYYRAEKDHLIYVDYDKNYTLQGFQLVPYYDLMK